MNDKQIAEQVAGYLGRKLMINKPTNSITPDKPKSKQEIAEFMAEKVLGMFECDEQWYHKHQTIPYTSDVERFIYSPEGFFAVWDVVEKKLAKNLGMYDLINRFAFALYYQDGKDRYEAFYNAIWEVYKENEFGCLHWEQKE